MIPLLAVCRNMCNSDTLSDHELSHDQPLAVSSTQDSLGDVNIGFLLRRFFGIRITLTDKDFA